MERFDWLSFTTDFGYSDGYVACCRGVVAQLAPTVQVIDVTHDVPPGDVRRGSLVLAQTVRYLPRAVHLAVVDPGVGTARRPVALEAPGGLLVGPDNGLLGPAADALGGIIRAVELTESAWFAASVAPTFHGRDVFAPVAARLALGGELPAAGVVIDPASLLRLPPPVLAGGPGRLDAEVLSLDRFGNVQLAARAGDLEALGELLAVAGFPARRVTTFGAVPPGDLAVFVDSAGHVAIAVNCGRAAETLSVQPGDVVRVTAAIEP